MSQLRYLIFAIGLLNIVTGYTLSAYTLPVTSMPDGPTLPPPVDENLR